ncbi:radical SAM family heme chaperone HemW [Tenacibaculum geojense]|uniref:Heme chaperone HemW n=1 Tax=Tenacibaculum geojense TaxID=915352 RepID=A0ABW3JU26_9FLAO
MSGIYIHIPFCKQACYYCDFHFSTSLKYKEEMLMAIQQELILRKETFKNEQVATIYFGGGTPSILSSDEINQLIATVYANYKVVKSPEITLEANPDDLTTERLLEIADSKVNRLSIGIQSFFEKDLKLMNRAHDAEEAKRCLATATQYFDNISIDLIYGIPNTTNDEWKQNIETALSFGVPHISSYALTVEPKTALASFIEKGIIDDVDDEKAQEQFLILVDTLTNEGFTHYELSNFGKDNFFSKNNSAYWQGKKYMGVGPSAHSFNGSERGWNIANNKKYINSIQQQKLPIEIEELSVTDSYNEYVMTGLRTIWGVSFTKVREDFGPKFLAYLKMQSEKFVAKDLLYIENNTLKATRKGKFLTDGIASDLFKLNL